MKKFFVQESSGNIAIKNSIPLGKSIPKVSSGAAYVVGTKICKGCGKMYYLPSDSNGPSKCEGCGTIN